MRHLTLEQDLQISSILNTSFYLRGSLNTEMTYYDTEKRHPGNFCTTMII